MKFIELTHGQRNEYRLQCWNCQVNLEKDYLAEICSYISYSSIIELAKEKKLKHMTDSILGDYAEFEVDRMYPYRLQQGDRIPLPCKTGATETNPKINIRFRAKGHYLTLCSLYLEGKAVISG